MWRKEAFGTLLWALEHLAEMPQYGLEFMQQRLDEAVTRYGSVAGFRSEGRLRTDEQIEAAWLEADARFGATEGRAGEDAQAAWRRPNGSERSAGYAIATPHQPEHAEPTRAITPIGMR